MMIFGICMISLGSVMPYLSDELQLNELAKGSLASVLPIGILLGSFIFGPIVDRYSYRFLLSVSGLITALGIMIIGLAHVLFWLQVSFFLIGLGGGLLNGSTSALVSDLSTEGSHQKGANLSLLGVFFGVGALGIPGILGLMPEGYNYRWVMFGVGSFILVSALYFLLIRYPVAKQSSFQGFGTWKILLTKRLLLSIAMVLFFQAALESMVNNWTATYFIENTGLETQPALFSLTLFVFSFTLTRLVLKFLLRNVAPFTILFISVFIALSGGIILKFNEGIAGAYSSMVLIGIGLAAAFPILLGIIGEAFKELSGTAFSMVFTIALIGNTLLNYMIGWITEVSGMGAYPVVYGSSILLFGLLLIPVYNLHKFIHNEPIRNASKTMVK